MRRPPRRRRPHRPHPHYQSTPNKRDHRNCRGISLSILLDSGPWSDARKPLHHPSRVAVLGDLDVVVRVAVLSFLRRVFFCLPEQADGLGHCWDGIGSVEESGDFYLWVYGDDVLALGELRCPPLPWQKGVELLTVLVRFTLLFVKSDRNC